MVLSTCVVVAVKCRHVLHNCVVTFSLSAMTIKCLSFIFENRVAHGVASSSHVPLMDSFN